MSIIMRDLLNIIIIICVCLNWGCTKGAQEREADSHTIQLSSLFPSSSSCVLSPKASNTKSSLHVAHRHGPCSPHGSGNNAASPDQDDILRRDQERVNSIHSKLSKKFTNRVMPSQLTEIPAKDGKTIGTGNYIVTIGIGTPKQDLSLEFDTGSDLTWVQCEPCAGSCYPQKEPIFNPSSSSSFSNISCSSPVCASLSSAGVDNGCLPSNCVYRMRYVDGSVSVGYIGEDKVTLTTSDVFEGFKFGCGQDNQGLFNGVAGLLGLGRNKLSFPSQTAVTYNSIFSYCLPSSPSFTGHLTFGSDGISDSVKFTPIPSTTFASFYGLDIVGISVDDQKLDIPLTVFSTPGAIIDSGAVISRLPPKAYEALKSAFKEKMSSYKATSPGQQLLDTCYDFTGVDMETVKVPKISFAFNGDTVVDLAPVGVLYALDESHVCLAFAANSDDRDAAIFGNVQQKTMQVVYDGPGKRVGFAPNGCS